MTEHVDVLIVGAGLSGIGAALPPAGQLPGPQLRDPRGARAASAARGTCSAIPASARTRTCTRSATRSARGRDGEVDRRRPVDPRATCARPRASTGSTARSASTIGSSRAEWSSDGCALDGRRRARRHRRAGARSPAASCSCARGYYRYDEGYTPEFPGTERFAGAIVHPQYWTEDIDYAGKRVVVIGSGATAVTLVPAMAERAAHVTMLQRSPSYVVSLPGGRPARQALLQAVPAARSSRTRSCAGRTCCSTMLIFQLSRRRPEADEDADPQGAGDGSCRPATTSTRTSSPATTPGISACAWCPTATCSRRSAQGKRRRWSPIGSRRSPRRASARVRRASSRPT